MHPEAICGPTVMSAILFISPPWPFLHLGIFFCQRVCSGCRQLRLIFKRPARRDTGKSTHSLPNPTCSKRYYAPHQLKPSIQRDWIFRHSSHYGEPSGLCPFRHGSQSGGPTGNSGRGYGAGANAEQHI